MPASKVYAARNAQSDLHMAHSQSGQSIHPLVNGLSFRMHEFLYMPLLFARRLGEMSSSKDEETNPALSGRGFGAGVLTFLRGTG